MAYGVYDVTGAIRVSIVDGLTRVGRYAADGSWNVVVSTGGTPIGFYHRCGGINVTLTTSRTGFYAPDGSMYVAESPGLGATYVIAVSGTFSGGTAFVNPPYGLLGIFQG